MTRTLRDPYATSTSYDAGAVRDAIEFVSAGPPPGGLLDLLQLVADRVKKPIRLERIGDRRWGSVTGLLLVNASGARILVRETDPLIYQTRCILHEVGHLLCSHPTCRAPHSRRRLTTVRRLDAYRAAGLTNDDGPAAREFAAEHIARAAEGHVMRPEFHHDEAAWALS